MTTKLHSLAGHRPFSRRPPGQIFLAALGLLFLQTAFALTGATSTVAAAGHPEATQGQTPSALEAGKAFERDIRAGESHTYTLTLTAGQYARVSARQQGISVVLKLLNPDGSRFIEADTNGETEGNESLTAVVELTGNYRVEVQASNKTAPTGRYELRLEELRPANETDKTAAAAEKTLLEGDQLRSQNRGEALREAMKKYEEAAALYRALADRKGEASAIARLANVYYRLSDMPKALAAFNQALPVFKALGEPKLEAYVMNEIGLIYQSLGDLDKAFENYQQSLNLKRQVNDRWGEAATIDNIGLLYSSQGYKQKALEFYLQALQLRHDVHDREGEAGSLNNLGSVSNALGKKDKALDYYEQAVVIWRAIGDKRSEAVTLSNLGVLSASLADKDKALAYYHQALQISQETGNKQSEAVLLNNIGQFFSASGDKQKALEYYTKSLELRRAIPDRRGIANMLSNLGSLHNSMGDRQKGLDHYQQALSIARDVGDLRLVASILQAIGRTYDVMGDKAKALDYYQQSLALSRSVTDTVSEAAMLATIAQFERDRNNLMEARKHIEAAVAIIDDLRSGIETQEIRANYFATVKKYYDLYVDILMQLQQQNPTGDYQAEALQVSERARARMLIETLIEAKAKIRQGVDPALLTLEANLQKQLGVKASTLTRLMSSKADEEQLTKVRNEVEATRRQIQQTRNQIRITSPRYAALTQPVALSLAEIQKQVVDENTLLLEYSLGEERSHLWAITPNSINSFPLPKRQEIEKAAKQVYALLTARNQVLKFETKPEKQQRIAKADAEFEQAAQALSQLILSPVAAQLGRKKLLIVSDGLLHYIPFAALPEPTEQAATPAKLNSQRTAPASRNYEPLLINHEVVSIPSASTLTVLRNEVKGRAVAPKTLAILADPVFDKEDERFKSEVAKRRAGKPAELVAQRVGFTSLATEDARRALEGTELLDSDYHLPRLLGTRREAQSISALVAKTDVKAALDFTANRELAMNPELRQYRYLHFATHGVLNSQYPELSGIVLSLIDEDGNPQEGFLRGNEIYNLQLPVDLVVLSGCQTGLGQNLRGEGIVGLTRSFMYAGAARVLVSLWAVNDESTALLMTQFYRDLLNAGKPATAASALRSAQLSMLKDRRFNAPYYWAAFILQGEPK